MALCRVGVGGQRSSVYEKRKSLLADPGFRRRQGKMIWGGGDKHYINGYYM